MVVIGGFASAVTEPAFTSLGGGGFLLARTETGEVSELELRASSGNVFRIVNPV